MSLTFQVTSYAVTLIESESIKFEHNSNFATASIPPSYLNLTKKLDRVWNGKNDDLFQFIAWNRNAKIVAIWAPKLKFKDNSHSFQIRDEMFIPGLNGGVFYCKGCPEPAEISSSIHEETPSYAVLQLLVSHLIENAQASDELCFGEKTDGIHDVTNFNSQLSQEIGSRGVLDSLKTCNWSLTQLIQNSLSEIKNTVGEIISGNFFSQIAGAIMEFEKTIQAVQTKILPLLSELRNNLQEVFDHLVCDFTQRNIQNVVMAAVVPGGGAVGATAKISLNIVRFEENLRALIRHEGVLKAFRSIKQRNEGKLPDSYIRAISEIRTTLPVKPQSFGSNISRESHFRSHSELRFKSSAEYEKAAIDFASRNVDSSVVIQTQKNKRWVKYDLNSKEFVVMNKKGELITYFRKTNTSDEHAFERFIKEFEN